MIGGGAWWGRFEKPASSSFLPTTNNMSRSTGAGHFFQTTWVSLAGSRSQQLTVISSALNESARKATKSKNTKGNPVKLQSKILAAAADPHDSAQVYVAEAAGNVKRINLEVGQTLSFSVQDSARPFFRPPRQLLTVAAVDH